MNDPCRRKVGAILYKLIQTSKQGGWAPRRCGLQIITPDSEDFQRSHAAAPIAATVQGEKALIHTMPCALLITNYMAQIHNHKLNLVVGRAGCCMVRLLVHLEGNKSIHLLLKMMRE